MTIVDFGAFLGCRLKSTIAPKELKNKFNYYLSYIRNNITVVEAVYSLAVYKTAKIFSNPGYMGVIVKFIPHTGYLIFCHYI